MPSQSPATTFLSLAKPTSPYDSISLFPHPKLFIHVNFYSIVPSLSQSKLTPSHSPRTSLSPSHSLNSLSHSPHSPLSPDTHRTRSSCSFRSRLSLHPRSCTRLPSSSRISPQMPNCSLPLPLSDLPSVLTLTAHNLLSLSHRSPIRPNDAILSFSRPPPRTSPPFCPTLHLSAPPSYLWTPWPRQPANSITTHPIPTQPKFLPYLPFPLSFLLPIAPFIVRGSLLSPFSLLSAPTPLSLLEPSSLFSFLLPALFLPCFSLFFFFFF